MVCVEQMSDENRADELCAVIHGYMVEAAKTKSEKEKVKDVTLQNLINWGVVKNLDGTLVSTNALILLTNNTFPFAKIQCALFKGTEIANPFVHRVICMAVTSTEYNTLDGSPTSWSAAIDSIASGADEEDEKRLFIVSAGNVYPEELGKV